MSSNNHAKNPLIGNLNELLAVRFSHNNNFFVCGFSHGFSTYQIQPFKELTTRQYFDANFELIDMFEPDLILLVGSSKNNNFRPNKVSLWEEGIDGISRELAFSSPVLGVQINADYIIVATNNMVSIYRVFDLAIVDEIRTFPNPNGIFSISLAANCIVSFPGDDIGTIRAISCKRSDDASVLINAHTSELTNLQLNYDGTMLVSASKADRSIFIWNPTNGIRLFKIRKDTEAGCLCSFAFSDGDFYFAASYSVGITNVYTLEGNKTGSDSDTDNEENCIDVMALHFFDTIFCGLVGSTLSLESEKEHSFAKLYSDWSTNQPQQQQLTGKSSIAFSFDSPYRLFQVSFVGNVLIKYDFESGGEIHAAQQPSLKDGENVYNTVLVSSVCSTPVKK